MFEIRLKPKALRQLKKLKRYYAEQILAAMEKHLCEEPERTSASRIRKLRGKQTATYRLRVGDYRVFYDVGERLVSVIAILHKSETEDLYREELP